MVCKTWR